MDTASRKRSFMPRLRSCRQEAFADLVASGMQPRDAVTAAGYRTENPKVRAQQLLMRVDMLARVAELRRDKPLQDRSDAGSSEPASPDAGAGGDAQDPEAALEDLLRSGGERAVDKDWIVECLVENIERSLGLKPLRDRSGRTVGSYSHQGSVANKALELLGRQLGLFGEKRDGKGGGFDDLSDEDLDELGRDLERRIAALEGIQRRVETRKTQTTGEQ